METLNSYFEKIYCINLDRATERWEKCVEQFDNLNIKVERFSAIEPSEGINNLLKGEIGCMRSHFEIIKKAKELNLKNVFIFEDDVQLVDGFNEKYAEYVKEVPENWDFIYFGGNHLGGLQKKSEHVYKMIHTYTTHAIGIKNTMFDLILNNLPNEQHQVDVYYALMMPPINAYVIRPHLAFQREGFSYIQNQVNNYEFLK